MSIFKSLHKAIENIFLPLALLEARGTMLEVRNILPDLAQNHHTCGLQEARGKKWVCPYCGLYDFRNNNTTLPTENPLGKARGRIFRQWRVGWGRRLDEHFEKFAQSYRKHFLASCPIRS